MWRDAYPEDIEDPYPATEPEGMCDRNQHSQTSSRVTCFVPGDGAARHMGLVRQGLLGQACESSALGIGRPDLQEDSIQLSLTGRLGLTFL